MVPRMSRSANPDDNASCESFVKSLKGEEIYASLAHECQRVYRAILQRQNCTRRGLPRP